MFSHWINSPIQFICRLTDESTLELVLFSKRAVTRGTRAAAGQATSQSSWGHSYRHGLFWAAVWGRGLVSLTINQWPVPPPHPQLPRESPHETLLSQNWSCSHHAVNRAKSLYTRGSQRLLLHYVKYLKQVLGEPAWCCVKNKSRIKCSWRLMKDHHACLAKAHQQWAGTL